MSVSVAGPCPHLSPQLRARGDSAGLKVHSAWHFLFVSWSQIPWCKFPSGTPCCSSPLMTQAISDMSSLPLLSTRMASALRPSEWTRSLQWHQSRGQNSIVRHSADPQVTSLPIKLNTVGLGSYWGLWRWWWKHGSDEKTAATAQWSWGGFKQLECVTPGAK